MNNGWHSPHCNDIVVANCIGKLCSLVVLVRMELERMEQLLVLVQHTKLDLEQQRMVMGLDNLRTFLDSFAFLF